MCLELGSALGNLWHSWELQMPKLLRNMYEVRFSPKSLNLTTKMTDSWNMFSFCVISYSREYTHPSLGQVSSPWSQFSSARKHRTQAARPLRSAEQCLPRHVKNIKTEITTSLMFINHRWQYGHYGDATVAAGSWMFHPTSYSIISATRSRKGNITEI
jgi:hypothetical protein